MSDSDSLPGLDAFVEDYYRRFSEVLAAFDKAPLAAMVLKAPHHGSRYSNSPEFVKAVSPKDVLISAGHQNYFRHPHPSVVARYASAGAKVWRTDQRGAIRVVTDGHGYRVEDYRSMRAEK